MDELSDDTDIKYEINRPIAWKRKNRQKVVLGILTGPELTGAHDF
ncbi:hypothetical protein [Polynucleobacter sp. UK-FUSCHL-C3]|jgi:hypothetical protein